MSSHFYSLTMGFMVLAAVPVLAIKYHNSHGRQNTVSTRSHNSQNAGQTAGKAESPQGENRAEHGGMHGGDGGAPAFRALQSSGRTQHSAPHTPLTGVARSRPLLQPMQQAARPLPRAAAQIQPVTHARGPSAGAAQKSSPVHNRQAMRHNSSKNR